MTGTGSGPAAAYGFQNAPAGPITTFAFTFDSTQKQYVTNPIPYSGVKDQISIVAFGTGFRAGKVVRTTIGTVAVPVAYAGPQGTDAGLDQLNVGPLPAGIPIGSDVPLVMTVDGVSSNPVTLRFK